MDDIKISVVIPVFNCATYIERCLTSIKNQEITAEIILIDDCSTDNLCEKLKEIKEKLKINIVYIKNPKRLGVAKTRNKGILKATGNYIAFLDADDWWECGKLKKQIETIKETKTKFIYTGRINVKDNYKKIVKCPNKVDLKHILYDNPITCSSVLIEKELATKYLMVDSNICEDYYMWIQILKEIPCAIGILEPLTNYFIREDSLSSNKFKHAIKRYNTYKMAEISFFKRIYYSIIYILLNILKRAEIVKKG